MKKLFALLLALCMLCSAAALADQEIKGNAQVEMGIDLYVEEGSSFENGFTVYIPEGIYIAQGSTKGTANIRLDVYNTDGWDNAQKVQVALNSAENLHYGHDDERDENWWCYNLANENENFIVYSLYKNNDENQTIMPCWQSDEFQSYGFEGVDCILTYMYAWGEDCCDGRYADIPLTVKLEVGDEDYEGGSYSDNLTFDIRFEPGHCGEAFYDANTLYIPDVQRTTEGYELCKAGDTEYCRNYEGEGYVYYSVVTAENEKSAGEVVDVTGFTMTMQFNSWENSIANEDKWLVEDSESKLNGVEIYNWGAFGDSGYMTYPRSQYEESSIEDYQSNWFSELTFTPYEQDWPW